MGEVDDDHMDSPVDRVEMLPGYLKLKTMSADGFDRHMAAQ